jgi:hypothetical protein
MKLANIYFTCRWVKLPKSTVPILHVIGLNQPISTYFISYVNGRSQSTSTYLTCQWKKPTSIYLFYMPLNETNQYLLMDEVNQYLPILHVNGWNQPIAASFYISMNRHLYLLANGFPNVINIIKQDFFVRHCGIPCSKIKQHSFTVNQQKIHLKSAF